MRAKGEEQKDLLLKRKDDLLSDGKLSEKRGIRCAKQAGRIVLGILYPPRCPLCDRIIPVGRERVCGECREELPWIIQPYCLKCGKPLDRSEKEFCEACLAHPHDFTQGLAAFRYAGKMRDSVQRMKFSNRREYLDFYAEAMVWRAGKWLALWKPQTIIPVPMHWIKKNRRGFNQSELLAKRIGKLTGIPVLSHAVRKMKNTKDQKGLSGQERRTNLKNVFEVKEELSGVQSVLVVDDVYTTGSTMDEISRTLKRAGVKNVFFLVTAHR